MVTYEFRGRMTALSSISHNGGQSFGINQKLRREKFVQPDGTVQEVPVISGNGLRGMLRDRGMLHMVRKLGYGVEDATGQVSGLTLGAFYFLFSGGSLSSTGGKTIDIDRARKLRQLIPLIGIFGGAVGNQILPGRAKIGKAIPICAETAHILPEEFRKPNLPSVWDYLQEEMYTRKDDEKNEHLRGFITPTVRPLPKPSPQEMLLPAAAEPEPPATTAVALAEVAAEDSGPKQQMQYYTETFAAGTPFYWRVILDDVTDVEFDSFLTTLVVWSRMPFIGGKSNVGLGEVSVDFSKWISIDSRVATKSTEVGAPAGEPYCAHLTANYEAIREALKAL